MANSLFDQLKKSGLVDDKKARKIKKEKHQKKKEKKSAESGDDSLQLAQAALADKAARDRLLNKQRQEQAEQKAIAAQIRQLIEMNRIDNRDGDVAFSFSDGKRVQRIHITEALQQQLVKGRLAIVALDDRYELVPAAVAEKISQRDEQVVILLNQREEEVVDEDDPYADYQVPDDLMW